MRQGAYIRGNVLIGEHCVVGHATEIKSSVLLGDSKAGHFAYIGDSILGRVNLGAGTKLANLKITGSPIVITVAGKEYHTGLKKFGAILGDGVETGCNSVLLQAPFSAKMYGSIRTARLEAIILLKPSLKLNKSNSPRITNLPDA